MRYIPARMSHLPIDAHLEIVLAASRKGSHWVDVANWCLGGYSIIRPGGKMYWVCPPQAPTEIDISPFVSARAISFTLNLTRDNAKALRKIMRRFRCDESTALARAARIAPYFKHGGEGHLRSGDYIIVC